VAASNGDPDVVIWMDGLGYENSTEISKKIYVFVIADGELNDEVDVRCIYTRFVKQQLVEARRTQLKTSERLNHSYPSMSVFLGLFLNRRLVHGPSTSRSLLGSERE
jgi:hypothetical protein